MNPIEVEVYLCPECYRPHEESYDAKSCCELETSTRWECGACQEWHETETEAELCCKPDDEIDPIDTMRVSPMVLEQHGQERLF